MKNISLITLMLALLLVTIVMLSVGCHNTNTTEQASANEASYVCQTVVLENGCKIEVCIPETLVDSFSEADIYSIIDQHGLNTDCRITFYDVDEE